MSPMLERERRLALMPRGERCARKLAAMKIRMVRDHEGVDLPDDLWRQMADKGEAIGALQGLVDMVLTQAKPDAFCNGVTDSTGTVDEGEVWASRVIDDARTAIQFLWKTWG